MSKVVKRMLIDDLRKRLGESRDMLVLDTSKMTPSVDNRFRLTLVQKGIRVSTVKNSLARVALREAGLDEMAGLLKGPSVLAWGGGRRRPALQGAGEVVPGRQGDRDYGRGDRWSGAGRQGR